MKVIGIAGKSHSGKTICATAFAEQYKTIIYGFGHAVKQEFLEANKHLPWSWEELDKQEIKDWRVDCTVMEQDYIEIPVREALCRLGTGRREEHHDYWIEKWRDFVAEHCMETDYIIAPDVRFPNELSEIQELGGIVIGLTRNPHDGTDITETALDEVFERTEFALTPGKVFSYDEAIKPRFDTLIHNNTMSIEDNQRIFIEKVAKRFKLPAPISSGEPKITPTEYLLQSGRMANDNDPLLHGMIGICTEAGELLDAYKKLHWYGKSIDKVNITEELGDICWYMALIMRYQGLTWEDVWQKNIDKLWERYPEGFSKHHANNRNLKQERKVLEDV
jgi:NTP pyrophosphatase (non-canonical NTP hydrolase)